MVIGLRSIRLEGVPNQGKNGTSIYSTSFSHYKDAAPINEEETDEKSLYTVLGVASLNDKYRSIGEEQSRAYDAQCPDK
jgi:hypothetical protein